MTHYYQLQSITLYISGIVDHIIKIFGTQVHKQLFFKFINKCQIEILRCAPPSSHVCDFFNIACFIVAKAILYLKTVQTKISNKNILFVLNFALLTFNFQKY